jgi:hypothetical protein
MITETNALNKSKINIVPVVHRTAYHASNTAGIVRVSKNDFGTGCAARRPWNAKSVEGIIGKSRMCPPKELVQV